jgi:GNAT superfamily N-acetyltransferase
MTTDRVEIRAATLDELAAVLGVLDAAALETDADRVRNAIDVGDVLVAVPRAADTAEDAGSGPPVGALVLDGEAIANVAVRRRRRDQGIGAALVRRAADRRDRLVAEFDTDLTPFYESLGFEVESGDGGRCRGVLHPQ